MSRSQQRRETIQRGVTPNEAAERIWDMPIYTKADALEIITAAIATATAELRQHLGNLLAVIHRDGGHYQAEHGTEEAIRVAHERWASLVQAADEKDHERAMARFAPIGDNHHNAALCPHCGEPLRKALARIEVLEHGDDVWQKYCTGLEQTLIEQRDKLAAAEKRAEELRAALQRIKTRAESQPVHVCDVASFDLHVIAEEAKAALAAKGAE